MTLQPIPSVVSNLGNLQTNPAQQTPQQQQQQIQLVQQIVTPNGEIQHVPVSESLVFPFD